MNRTEKLLIILIVLCISFIAYIFYIYHDNIIKNISTFFSKFKENEVIVPYDKTVNHLNYEFLTAKETNNFKPANFDDIKSIYYTVLNNGWTEFTFYCPSEYETCVNDIKTLADKNSYVTLINNYVNPYNTYVKYNTLLVNDSEIHLTVDKLYKDTEITMIENEVNKIFNELNINASDTSQVFNNIKKLHDYIIDNTTYDEEYEKGSTTISNKANGALFNKIALCSGYSDLFAIMLNKLNVPNFKVSNDEHIWNVLKYKDKWYHVDVTWDDDERNKNNTYNFYMVDTKELLEKDSDIHTFTISDYLELN